MIVNGAGIIVNGATSNVSIEYAWVPVPSPASTISPEKSPVPIGVSINYSVFYAVFSRHHSLRSSCHNRHVAKTKEEAKNVN